MNEPSPPARRRLAILAEGQFGFHHGKTAVGVIRYGPDEVVAVIDSTQAGGNVASILPGRDIPIVAAFQTDPIATGAIASLARPGSNVTGPAILEVGMAAKRVEILKTALPAVQRLGILWNMINKSSSAEAITAVVVGYLVGAAVALPFTREQASETQAVAEPTG